MSLTRRLDVVDECVSQRCHTQNPKQWVPGGSIRVITTENPTAPKPIWSKPRLILSAKSFGGIPKVICNKLIVLRTGEWILPYWREQTLNAMEDGTCFSNNRTDEYEVILLMVIVMVMNKMARM